MFILTDSNNVIKCIGSVMTDSPTEHGVIFIDGAGFGLFNQQLHEVDIIPEHIKPDKYKYINGEFSVNEDYKEPYDPEEDIKGLEDAILELTIALAAAQGGNV